MRGRAEHRWTLWLAVVLAAFVLSLCHGLQTAVRGESALTADELERPLDRELAAHCRQFHALMPSAVSLPSPVRVTGERPLRLLPTHGSASSRGLCRRATSFTYLPNIQSFLRHRCWTDAWRWGGVPSRRYYVIALRHILC